MSKTIVDSTERFQYMQVLLLLYRAVVANAKDGFVF